MTLGGLEVVLARSCGGLGRSWGGLGRSCALLGRSWVVLGWSWAVLGLSWGDLGLPLLPQWPRNKSGVSTLHPPKSHFEKALKHRQA